MNIFEKLFNKNNKNINDLDLYQLIALFNRLTHKKENLYTNNKGEKFVLTRYGFVPAEQHNLHLLTEQQNRQINHLETEVVILENDLKKSKEAYKKVNNALQNLLVSNKESKKQKPTQTIYSFKPQLDRLKKSYLTMLSNNHNLIERVKQLKKQTKTLSDELQNERAKRKLLEKINTVQPINTDEDLLTKINATIMYAENNQIGKMLEKLKSVVAHQENLKQKSHNQKALITRLESINKNLEQELFELKMKKLNN